MEDSLNMFNCGSEVNEEVLKKAFDLDDWPTYEEVLEYDTVKEEGWVYHGKDL